MTNYIFDAYIAVPYSSPYDWVREYRFRLATEYAKVLVERGLNPYSPITHSHPMAQHGIKGDWDTWQGIDRRIIPACKGLHIICCDGYDKSIGVESETDIFYEQGSAITYIEPLTWDVVYREEEFEPNINVALSEEP
jgi:hypothetical protein